MKLNTTQFIDIVIKNYGNIYSFDKTEYLGNNKPITVTCVKHNHDINVLATTLLRKTQRNNGTKKNPIVGSCPICREEYFENIKKEMFNKFRKAHNNKYNYDEKTYVNLKIPFDAICKIHGKFKVIGQSHSLGHNKCPHCTKNKNEKYINNVRFYVCDIHGNVPIGKKRLLSEGCPKCNIEKIKNNYDNNLLNKLTIKFGENYKFTINSNNVVFYCKKHEIERIVDRKKINEISKTKYICKKCLDEYEQTIAQPKNWEKAKQIVESEYGDIFRFISVISGKDKNNNHKIKFYDKHNNNEIDFSIKSILKGTYLSCYPLASIKFISFNDAKQLVQKLGIKSFREYKKWHKRTKQSTLPSNPQRTYKEWISYTDFFGVDEISHMSHGEKRIYKYLKKKNINFVWQKRFNDCKNKNPLPFDFYLPDYNIIVEFDGDQHYNPDSCFNLNQFHMIQKHDAIKNKYCLENNITLIRLKYDLLVDNVLEWELENQLTYIIAEQAIAFLEK